MNTRTLLPFLSRSRFCRAREGGPLVSLALAIVAVAWPASSGARGDEYVDRADALYADIETDRRSDLLLLPVLAEMDAPPASAGTLGAARLLHADSVAWEPARAWAMAAPQRRTLDVLDRITRDEDYRSAFAFGLPYGIDGVPPDLIRAGQYIDLGDPPMLAAARYLYMPSLDRMRTLVNVEATRLAAEGDVNAACDVLIDLLFFARTMADREMHIEARWGYETMADMFERVRDVLFEDFRREQPRVDPEGFSSLLSRIRRDEGFLGFDRLTFPRANRIASEQLVQAVYLPRGEGINPATFGPTMARRGSVEHPFRRFSESARWTGRTGLVDQLEAMQAVEEVFTGWSRKWELPPTDTLLDQPFEYRQLESSEDVVRESTPDMADLFNLRRLVRTEAVGTRAAIGVLGYTYRFGTFPPQLSAVRPVWLSELESDPYRPNPQRRSVIPPLEYFVPIRDAFVRDTARDDPQPHDMDVFGGDGVNFLVRLNDEDFILYSVGPDGDADRAEIGSDNPNAETGDYLIWPPILGLYRRHLIDTEQLP